ncbi:MAG: GNAT family N-acetyltransferase [Chitinophagaceae bacterium]
MQNLIVTLVNNQHFLMLETYLNSLSSDTKKRFGPHSFHINGIQAFYASKPTKYGIIIIDTTTVCQTIVAYAILQKTVYLYDKQRIEQYGYQLTETDGSYAPSVADAWQGKGLGKLLWNQATSIAKKNNMERIFLWGGVQSNNLPARKYYEKIGFSWLGSFVHNGWNEDYCWLK